VVIVVISVGLESLMIPRRELSKEILLITDYIIRESLVGIYVVIRLESIIALYMINRGTAKPLAIHTIQSSNLGIPNAT
jgi:hypothetical protein